MLAVPALLIAICLLSCSTKPEPFKYGQDNCYFCKMGIMDPKFGGEVITKKSKVYKFDDIICMVRFLKSGVLKENEVAQKLVINFDPGSNREGNDFLEAEKAIFWISPELKTPMGSNAAAFSTKEAAVKQSEGKPGKLMSWEELYNSIR